MSRLLLHQQEVLKTILNSPPNKLVQGFIVMASMGLGKTLIALVYALQCRMMREQVKPHFPTLIVCPKSVAQEWVSNINKFFPGIPFLYYHRDALKKSFDVLTRADFAKFWFVITTYDVVKTCAKNMDLLEKTETQEIGFGARKFIDRPLFVYNPEAEGARVLFTTRFYEIIADESHRMSTPTTMVYQSMMLLHAEKYLCLSGTPIMNKPTDLFSQLRWMGYTTIRHQKDWKADSIKVEQLDRIVLKINYEDANIILPALHRHRVAVKFMDPNEKVVFDYYLQKSRRLMNAYDENGGVQTFGALLGCFIRLAQTCIAPYLITPDSKRDPKKTEFETNIADDISNLRAINPGIVSWLLNPEGTAGIHSSKMLAFRKVFSRVPLGQKVLVFSSYTSALALAQKTLAYWHPEVGTHLIEGSKNHHQRSQILESFKTDDAVSVLFMGYKVGSEGLNIQEANHVIFLEPWWCPAVQDQALARTYRMGQTEEVHVYDLVVEDSIDTRIMGVMASKREMTKMILEGSTSISVKSGLSADMIRSFLSKN